MARTMSGLRATKSNMDTLGIEPRASRMLSGCDTTTPCALCCIHLLHMAYEFIPRTIECYRALQV